MIKLLTIWLMLSFGANDAAKINSLKKAGEEAYKAGNYELAASKFSMLVDSMQVADESAILNLGHSYVHLNKNEEAQRQYQKLILSKDKNIKSIAYQQLGTLSNDPQTLEKALSFFKASLKSDPSNEDARYNYELIKKKMDQQKDQNQDKNNQNQDQDKEQEEPSEWAKQLKKQAERMVAQRRYAEAYQLMQDGLKKDKTVSSFSDFIQRIGEVNDINGI